MFGFPKRDNSSVNEGAQGSQTMACRANPTHCLFCAVSWARSCAPVYTALLSHTTAEQSLHRPSGPQAESTSHLGPLQKLFASSELAATCTFNEWSRRGGHPGLCSSPPPLPSPRPLWCSHWFHCRPPSLCSQPAFGTE